MKATSLIGKGAFAIDTGRKLGTVERLLFSPEEWRVTALALTPDASALQPLIPVGKIRAIGQDAITVDAEADLEAIAAGELPAGSVAFDQIEGERIITERGEELGRVASLDFDASEFRLLTFELSRGFMRGNMLVNVRDVISIGEDAISVREAAAPGAGSPAAGTEGEGAERKEPDLA